MAIKLLRHKWQKVALSILLSLIFLVLLAAVVLNYWFSPILKDKLKDTVLKATDSLYHVQFSDAKLDILQGKVVVYNLRLNYDTAVYRQQKRSHKAPKQLYALNVNQLVLNHIHPFKIFFKHYVDIAELLIDAPTINIISKPDKQKPQIPKDDRTLYERLSKSLKAVHIGAIRFNNVKLKYEDYSSAKPSVSQFKELDLSADDLLIDSATQFDTKRFLYCHEVTVALKNYSGHSVNNLYGYKMKLLQFSTLTHQLTIHQLAVNSLHSPRNFFQKTYGDRFSLYGDLIRLNHFDFDIYNKSHIIKIGNLILSKGSVSIFSNPRTNPKSFFIDKSVTFPNRAIQLLPVKLKIDTVKISDYSVRYGEYNKDSKHTGYINFNKINGKLHNLTNDSASVRKNNICYVKLSSQFMGRAQTNLQFTFNLADSSYSYSYAGTMGPIGLQSINVATVPLASLKMESGQVNRFTFDFKGNRYKSAGKVTLLYSNLKIRLMNADSSKLKGLHLAIASLLANALIIKNNNPNKVGEVPCVANVKYLRPVNYPFFETLWRTLMMGIKKTAGLDAKTQQDADLKLAQKEKQKYFKGKDTHKKSKEEKRQLRKLKRAQRKARKKADKEAKNRTDATNSFK